MMLSMLVMALLVTFSACNKDDDDDDVLKTPTEYLTAHSWMTTSIEISPAPEIYAGIVINDLYEEITVLGQTFSFMEDCDKDDLIIFNTDGTVTDDAGATKCDPDEPQQTDGGTWVLSADGKTITSVSPIGTEDNISGQISTLDDNNFIMTLEITDDLGLGLGTEDYTLTIHMVK